MSRWSRSSHWRNKVDPKYCEQKIFSSRHNFDPIWRDLIQSLTCDARSEGNTRKGAKIKVACFHWIVFIKWAIFKYVDMTIFYKVGFSKVFFVKISLGTTYILFWGQILSKRTLRGGHFHSITFSRHLLPNPKWLKMTSFKPIQFCMLNIWC